MKAAATISALLIAASAAAEGAPASFDDCERRVSRHPGTADGYRCYVEAAARVGSWDEAARLLDARISVDPDDHLAELALATVEARRGGERAEALFIDSVGTFESRGEALYEVTARLEYATFLALRGRTADSGEQLTRAVEIAQRSGDPLLSAWVGLHVAKAEYGQARYEAAERRLAAIREVLFRDGSPYQRSTWHGVAGSVHWGMTRYAEALEDYRRQADLLRAMGDAYDEAVARSNIVLVAGRIGPYPYTPATRARLTRLTEEARDTAIRGGNRGIEGKCELYLAQLSSDTGESRAHEERGLALAGQAGNVEDVLLASRLLAENLARNEPRDPQRALEVVGEAIDIAEATGLPQQIARTRIVQSTLLWEMVREGIVAPERRGEAIRLSLLTLDAIEAIRDRQSRNTARARTFSPWTFFYARFAGHLLWPPDERPSPADLDLAFRVVERMRARVFLEDLDVAGAVPAPADLPWRDIPRLARVQENLRDDEALLVYLTEDLRLNDVFTGGSWVMTISRDDVGLYAIPQKSDLEAVVDLTLGAIRRRDGSERVGLERLYRELLERPLRGLPETVDHLVIVADGPLHRLPFGALRDGRRDEPIGARYRLSRVPSVTTWLYWTSAPPRRATGPAAAWIDPDTGGSGESGGTRGVHLVRLPYTAMEARAMRRHLGEDVRVLAGKEATERAFKRAASEPAEILHLAAHAVVNEARPELSGVVLAGGSGEDGLLQVREIADLDLGSRTVVLSACRSASGATLAGEGVLSLARAFFVAGAQAVVANI